MSDTVVLVEDSTRIAGVGAALFGAIAVTIVSMLVCCVGSNARRPGPYYLTATLMFGFTMFIIGIAEKESMYMSTAVEITVTERYNTIGEQRLGIVGFLLCSAVIAIITLIYQHLIPPQKARPVDDLESTMRRSIF